MDFRSILITGGAGFVGSHLALSLKRDFPSARVIAADNLVRRGSELNRPRLIAGGVELFQIDIRDRTALRELPRFDLLIACAAEPAVTASLGRDAQSALDTNLIGTLNSFEVARQHGAAILFISTSRVYPISALNELPYLEKENRFEWLLESDRVGCSAEGIREDFPLQGARSFYGSSKLAAELLAGEYAHQYALPVLINRAGLLCGPWQMAKADQGVVTLWIARHVYRRPIEYHGYGGSGRQVRDALDIEDFCQLVEAQLQHVSSWASRTYNVGGGMNRSFSLRELTSHCERLTGWTAPVARKPEAHVLDVRIYVSDARQVQRDFDFQPKLSLEDMLIRIERWVRDYREELQGVLNL